MLMGMPAQWGLIALTALLIVWSSWSGGRNAQGANAAEASNAVVAGLVAAGEEWTAAGERVAAVIRGDGARWAVWSLAMDRGFFAEAYRATEYTLFGSGAPAETEATTGNNFVTAQLSVSGDGFSTEQEAGIVPVQAKKKERMNPKHGDPAAIDAGGGTFNTLCGTYCHGGQAIGGGCPSLIDEFWIHGDSDLEMYKVIAGGAGTDARMGAFGGRLSADQIWEIIAYLRHRNKEFLMEKAGPNSFRAKGEKCPNEIMLTLNLAGGRSVEGVVIIEDTKALMLEDRSEALPRQFRVDKDRILDAKLSCTE